MADAPKARAGRGRDKSADIAGAAAEKPAPASAAAAGDQPKKQKGGGGSAANAGGGVNEKGFTTNDTVTSRVSMGDTGGRMSTVNIEEATAKVRMRDVLSIAD